VAAVEPTLAGGYPHIGAAAAHLQERWLDEANRR
jgi:hypothetical protein